MSGSETTKGYFLSAKVDFDELAILAGKLGSAPNEIARALKSGLSSAGFHFKKQLTDAVKGNALGWPELKKYPGSNSNAGAPMTAHMSANWATKGRRGFSTTATKRKLFGKLARILRYQFVPEKLRTEVGVLPQITGDKSAILARNFQLGIPHWGRAEVTPSMRKYFAAIGMPLSPSTTRIKPAERPLFGPVFDKNIAYIETLIFTVVADKLTRGFAHRDILDREAGWL